MLLEFTTKLDITKIEDQDTQHIVQQIVYLATQITKDFQAQQSYERLYQRVLDQTREQQDYMVVQIGLS